MGGWRIVGILAVMLLAPHLARCQPYVLTEKAKAGDCYRFHMTMTLHGTMNVSKSHQPVVLKLAADAGHDFPERVLTASPDGIIQKTARYYEKAQATITIGEEKSERTLRQDRRIVVAQEQAGKPLTYSPAGPLTPEELELVGEHFDTLSLTGLLPPRPVAVADTWKPTNDVVQYLCNFEGLTAHDLVCRLIDVKEQTARLAVDGSSSGIELGAMVKLTIHAICNYDLKTNRLVAVEWNQKDERGQGPASPATMVESTIKITREPIAQPDSLSDVALISVPEGFEPPATMTQISTHHEFKTPFDLTCSREWQIVGQTEEHLVLRALDRGDFVAQVTITPWDTAKPGEHLSPEAFRDAMNKTPGWEPSESVEETEVPAENGRWLYRISVPGKMDGLKVVQYFYLLASPTGEQIVLAFTMTPAQVERLGGRDLALIRGLEFCHKPEK
jgi:hypothetical protein